jgi:hypothetical protein
MNSPDKIIFPLRARPLGGLMTAPENQHFTFSFSSDVDCLCGIAVQTATGGQINC